MNMLCRDLIIGQLVEIEAPHYWNGIQAMVYLGTFDSTNDIFVFLPLSQRTQDDYMHAFERPWIRVRNPFIVRVLSEGLDAQELVHD